MKLFDYSQIHYTVLNKQAVPMKRGGKFVQLANDIDDEDYLIISPAALSKYHANIVERFCRLHSLEGRYTTAKKDHFIIFDPAWEIKGGGYWEIDDAAKSFSLGGFSQAYGSCDLQEIIRQLLLLHCFPSYTCAVI